MDTPNLDKMREAREAGSQEIGRFLEWLDEQGVALAHYEVNDELTPYPMTTEELLAAFYGVDLKAAENERRAVLAALSGRGNQEGS